MGNVHEVGAPDPQLGRIFGVAEPLACRSTAIVSLTASRGGARISSHTLTNPYLALHVLGGYRDRSDVGELNIAGPAAIFYPGGSAHEMVIAPSGLSTVIVEFDPDWLQRLLGAEANFGAPRQWVGGEAGRRAGESGENLKLRLGLRDTHRPTRRFYVEAHGILRRRLSVEILRHVPERGEVGGSMSGPDAAFVVAEHHIHDPV